MKRELCPLLIVCLALEYCVNAYIPRSYDGRPRGGFLGIPRMDKNQRLTPPKAQWFTQRLNHFDNSDTRTWQQKYFVNETFYDSKKGGPLFVFIGGESPFSPFWLTGGTWITYAERFGAFCMGAEHRYYGESHPTQDVTTENLKYLSSEQALADLAVLIIHYKEKYNFTKTIVFGGSYAGSLAAWFRAKYPHVTDGAIANSAPILAKVDFYEYLEVVTRSLTTFDGTTKCDDSLRNATTSMAQLMESPSGRDKLKDLFNLCTDIDVNNYKDVANLYHTLIEPIMGTVQNDRVNAEFDFGQGPQTFGDDIHDVCQVLTNEKQGTPLQRFAKEVGGSSGECIAFKYDDMIQHMKATSWDMTSYRTWFYQKCTEFNFFKTTNSEKQPFGHGVTLPFFIDQCRDVFGPSLNKTEVTQAVLATNDNYGGLDIQLTKAVFFNGGLDPWHALGIITPTHMEDVHTFFVKGVSHCAIMSKDSPDDPPALRAARKAVGEIIKKWL